MPTVYTGMSIEPVTIPYEQLFLGREQLQKEIDRRAWAYLRQIGYTPYREISISVSFAQRGTLQIVHIVAQFEQQHNDQNVAIDVPLTQFRALVPEKTEAS